MDGVSSTNSGRAARARSAAWKLAACCLILSADAIPAFGLSASVDIEPARVRVGEPATLSIRIDGGGAPEGVSIPEIDGLSMEFSGTRRSFQFINGRISSETALTYRLVPLRAGSFTIPPLSLRRGSETASTKPLGFTAYEGSPRSARSGGMLGGLVLVSRRNIVTGEPVLLRYYLVHGGIEFTRAPVFEEMPAAKGFLIKQIDEMLPDEAVRAGGGEFTRTHLATFAAIPLEAGHFALGGGSISITVSEPDPGSFFPFVMPASRRVSFDTAPVSVAPLPASGRPEGFRGDVGDFTIKAEMAEGDNPAFSERRITVTVAGSGNLLSMSPVGLQAVSGLTIIGGGDELRLSAVDGTTGGERRFMYTVIPERAGAFVLPGPRLSFYNPASGRYELARGSDIHFEAAFGGRSRKKTPGGQTETGQPALEFDPLPLLGIALVAAGGVAGLLWWRRREAGGGAAPVASDTPDGPVRTRPADLRTDLASAVRRRDAEGFLKIADRMLKEAKRAGREEAAPGLEELGREIGQYRYAGRPLSDAEMDDLYRRIREIGRRDGPSSIA